MANKKPQTYYVYLRNTFGKKLHELLPIVAKSHQHAVTLAFGACENYENGNFTHGKLTGFVESAEEYRKAKLPEWMR